MTQLTAARKGETTPEMDYVARREGLEAGPAPTEDPPELLAPVVRDRTRERLLDSRVQGRRSRG